MKTILFFSTNFLWGGSEILWTSVAKKLISENYKVKAIAGYDFRFLKPYLIDETSFFLNTDSEEKRSLRERIYQKLKSKDYSKKAKLENFIQLSKPLLAIISQGNNTEGVEFIELICKHKIPFVTITHLVVESTWTGQNDEKLNKLRSLFDKSLINFFVSKHTLKQHEKFIGYKSSNSKLTYNPFTKQTSEVIKYPNVVDGQYCVALIGRLEVFHKGYDLLIDVLSKDKWKNRNITFSIYGNGPHMQLIKRLIELNNITNVVQKGHIEKIPEVWKQHHILMMPSRLEGQSLTLIEAMHFKRAAIVTQVGGVEELVEEGVTGFIAPFPQVQAIDDALERAWEQRNSWEEMGINAYEKILQAHPANAVDYFIDEIKYLLDDNNAQMQ